MTIYVSNLMSQVNEEELKKAFAVYGAVASCKIIGDKFTGVSRGFGFVDMSNDEEGNKAIKGLDGTNLGGRNISVAIAKERVDRSFPSGRSY
jgi:RNA recognition motif-containing protein